MIIRLAKLQGARWATKFPQPKNCVWQFLVVICCLLFANQGVFAQSRELPAIMGQAFKHVPPDYILAEKQQAPAGFPAPLYTSNVNSSSFSGSAARKGEACSAKIDTADDFEQASKSYKGMLSSAGWTLETVRTPPPKVANTFCMLKAHKGQFIMVFTCMHAPNSTATTLNITVVHL